jgi:hypothetical protein
MMLLLLLLLLLPSLGFGFDFDLNDGKSSCKQNTFISILGFGL